MKIPNLPNRFTPIIDQENQGLMHPAWHMFFDQLIQEMQKNLSQEGIFIPNQTTENILTLQSANPEPSIVINKDTAEPYIALGGVFKKILTS